MSNRRPGGRTFARSVGEGAHDKARPARSLAIRGAWRRAKPQASIVAKPPVKAQASGPKAFPSRGGKRRDSRQGLATLWARQGLPNRSRKPFCENYFRSLKGSSLRCRYGRCPYRRYVLPMHVQGRVRQPRGYSNQGLVRRSWRTTSFEPRAFHPHHPRLKFRPRPAAQASKDALLGLSDWKRTADLPRRQRMR